MHSLDSRRRRRRNYKVGDVVTASSPEIFMPGTPAKVTAIGKWGSPLVEWVTFGRGAGTTVVPAWKLQRVV